MNNCEKKTRFCTSLTRLTKSYRAGSANADFFGSNGKSKYILKKFNVWFH